MGVTNRKSVYPFAECVEVQMEGTTSIDVMTIPKGTIIEKVIARVTIQGTGTPGNLIVGDDDDDNGFITAVAATGAVGTVIGDVPTEHGDYLYDSTVKGGYIKLYASAGKEVKAVLSADTATVEPAFQIIVYGKRYSV